MLELLWEKSVALDLHSRALHSVFAYGKFEDLVGTLHNSPWTMSSCCGRSPLPGFLRMKREARDMVSALSNPMVLCDRQLPHPRLLRAGNW